MNTKEIPNFVTELLKKISQENGISDYSIEINPGSKPGDGFASELFRIKILSKKSDHQLELMCKTAPCNKHHREEFNSNILFSRESLLYSKLMPLLDKFQKEKNLSRSDQFTSYPKCYATVANVETEQYAIILEDLRPLGFTMWNKAKPARIENVRLTLQEMGKFHGLSIAMKDQKPVEFSEIKQVTDILNPLLRQSENLCDMLKNSYDRVISSLKSEDHKTMMQHIKDNLLLYAADCINENDSDCFKVLCHGDSWNNNFLYQFNDEEIAESICMLDWQIIRYASAATDLLYYLFTSTDKALRDQEYENLIAEYHDSLAKTVRLLGSDPNKLFTLENLKDELKRLGNYALIMGPTILEISFAESSEIPKFDEMFDKVAEGKVKIDLITGLSGNGQQEFDRRSNELLDDIVDFGYFRKIE